jgi:catechol 2,3-dioxygenase-like lactoylglutathione lyase family enzyme
MARDSIDHDGLNREDIKRFYDTSPPEGVPFALGKISHVVLKVADLERSVAFYTQVLGLRVSDAYPETMMPGRMVFLQCNNDHHGIALVGGAAGEARAEELHHFAFEVATVDEVFQAREHLERHGVPISFQGRRRAGQQIAVEFKDPDGHNLEICWGMDQIGPEEASRPPEEWRAVLSLEEALRTAPRGQDPRISDPALLRHE